MSKRILAIIQSILLAAIFVVPSLAADDEESLRKDLTAVIALQSLPCGQVIAVKTQAENDYAVTCKDKNKYHVFLNDKGRVIVEKIR